MTLTTEIPAGTPDQAVLRKLPVAAIAEHPDNPRKKLPKLDELAASLTGHGLIQPIVVVPVEAFMQARQAKPGGAWIQPTPGTTHVVIAGHRRCAAADLAGWEEIDAIVRPDLASAVRATVTFVTENAQRVELNPLEGICRQATEVARIAYAKHRRLRWSLLIALAGVVAAVLATI